MADKYWRRIKPQGPVWHKWGEWEGVLRQVWAICAAWEPEDNAFVTVEAPVFPALWCRNCWRMLPEEERQAYLDSRQTLLTGLQSGSTLTTGRK